MIALRASLYFESGLLWEAIDAQGSANVAEGMDAVSDPSATLAVATFLSK